MNGSDLDPPTRPVADAAAFEASPAHPADLERLDVPYLVPWGKPQVTLAASVTLACAAGIAWLAIEHAPWWWLGLLPAGAVGGFFVLFFRNPRRRTPASPGLLVAPADGEIWDVEELEEDRYLKEPAVRIGIFLSIFDVHVNRAPCDARVEWTEYRPGEFRDARSADAARINEANDIGLKSLEPGSPPNLRLLVRQISGAIARRIVCPLENGLRLRRGGLIGMIRYGSRTELWVPRSSGFEVEVARGDKVRGGETVLGRFSSPAPGGSPESREG